MQLEVDRYAAFGLCRDMLASVNVLRTFQPEVAEPFATAIRPYGQLLLTGEGSSRIFPAGQLLTTARRLGWHTTLHSEAGRQAQDYQLNNWAVLACSNSGKTAEVIRLYQQLQAAHHPALFSCTAAAQSPLEALATRGYVLQCGKESAVAATKSVIEQGLFLRAVGEALHHQHTLTQQLPQVAGQVDQALRTPIDAALIERCAAAKTIYFAGRHDGVAQELTLKTNEITRKPSDYLEGTYAVHGIEEIMQAGDVVVWIEPYAESEAKFHDVLVKGVGLTVIAIASRPTSFPTILIPAAGDLSGYVELAAGWNLLVEIGLALSVDLDKPQRARKVGNEYTSP